MVAATGASEADASTAVDAAGGSVKTAILMVRAGIDADEAHTRLDAAGGHFRDALR